MDNGIFLNRAAHLCRFQPCASIPLAAVMRTGTKAAGRHFLWITPGLCQIYPQFYAPGACLTTIWMKSAPSACPSKTGSYFFNSVWQLSPPHAATSLHRKLITDMCARRLPRGFWRGKKRCAGHRRFFCAPGHSPGPKSPAHQMPRVPGVGLLVILL